MAVSTTLKQKLTLILLGAILCLILLEIGMRMAGFALTTLQDIRNRRTLARKATYRILCLGESTTAGGGNGQAGRYPHLMEIILNDRASNMTFSVVNRGIPATNTSIILDELESNLDRYQPDIVVTMMGVNDEWEHRGHFLRDTSELQTFLNSSKAYKLYQYLCLHLADKFDPESLGNRSREYHLFKKDELNYRLSLFFHPGNPEILYNLGTLYKDNKYLPQAKKTLESLLRHNPDHIYAQIQLAEIHQNEKNLEQAKILYQNVLARQPENRNAQLGLAAIYQATGQIPEAENIYRKIIKENPKNIQAMSGLAAVYQGYNQFPEQKQMLIKTTEQDPYNPETYIFLGIFYINHRNYTKAVEALQQALAISPRHQWGHLLLAQAYWENGDWKQAEQTLKQLLKHFPDFDRAQGMLSRLYHELGLSTLSERYEQSAEKFRMEHYAPVTRRNYQAVHRILRQRGIPLVCVQYPIRRLEPLKQLFDNHDGIIFVDNEKSFKKALETKKYYDLFINNFAGDFGHATREGNRLLAENVAGAILNFVHTTNSDTTFQ